MTKNHLRLHDDDPRHQTHHLCIFRKQRCEGHGNETTGVGGQGQKGFLEYLETRFLYC